MSLIISLAHQNQPSYPRGASTDSNIFLVGKIFPLIRNQVQKQAGGSWKEERGKRKEETGTETGIREGQSRSLKRNETAAATETRDLVFYSQCFVISLRDKPIANAQLSKISSSRGGKY
jgi:hypothetical protein